MLQDLRTLLHHKPLHLLALSLLTAPVIPAQEAPRFIAPMDIPLDLSGNFMEPRSNHFHTGLDMRTQGREGIPVRAVADGWVSRIKISPWGYGKAVYIDHADGLTTVYAHLQRLEGSVGEACLDAQYRARDFSIDVYPEKGTVPVSQGQVIALSGNTGGSGGPHLHFEVRRTAGQVALDPEDHGFLASDKIPPEIIGVRIHPLTDSSRVAPYPGTAKGFAAQGTAGRHALKPGPAPAAHGTVGLSLHTVDRYDNSGFRFGVRSIELFVDSVPAFSTRFDEVNFEHNRYCNAHMEYGLFKASKMDYHRCYKLPNNKLRIYGGEPMQGRIALTPGRDHHIRFVVKDGRGNTSELAFFLRGATAEEASGWPQPGLDGSLFRYDTENILEEAGVRLTVPAGALYDDVLVTYARAPSPAKAFAPLHGLHDRLTPLHSSCTLAIETTDLPEGLRSKALVVSLDDQGKPSAHGGRWSQGHITTSVKSFGNYTVMVDTVPPTITNVDLRADMRGRKGFSITVTDDLSGIDTYRGTLDGQWILLDYEPKTNTLSHSFDKHTSASGQRVFKLEVKDERGNTSSWGLTFQR